MKKMKIKTNWNRNDLPRKGDIAFKDKSLTKQEFKDECDIDFLWSRYVKTGSFYDPLKITNTGELREPMFGDFTEFPDYENSLKIVRRADEEFMKLPASTRDLFGNSAEAFLGFVANPANYEKAVALGIIEKYVPKAEIREVTETPIVNPEV